MTKLAEVNLNEIEIGERFRKDYGDLKGLAGSLTKHGQIAPIAVKLNPEGAEKPYQLAAGGRRLAALSANDTKTVLIRIYPENISELELRSVELAENFYRKDLDYREQTALTAEIHRLQQAILGEKTSTSPDAEGWSMHDTAKMLGTSQASISRDVKMADLLESNPELFEGCKSKSEAQAVVRKVTRALETTQAAKKLAATPPESKKRELMDAYIVGDFFEHAKQLPDECVNFIEIDPPYGVDLAKQKAHNPNMDYSGYNEIDKEEYPTFLRKLFTESYRLLMNDSWLICWFAQQPWQEIVYKELTNVGFSLTRIYAAWIKPAGHTHRPLQQLANGIECFYYAAKGKAILQQPGHLNYFLHAPPAPNEKIHPTERPLSLMQEVLRTFARPNDRVLVPFAGSGNTLIAAYQLGMQPFGYDLTQLYKDGYLVRVNKVR